METLFILVVAATCIYIALPRMFNILKFGSPLSQEVFSSNIERSSYDPVAEWRWSFAERQKRIDACSAELLNARNQLAYVYGRHFNLEDGVAAHWQQKFQSAWHNTVKLAEAKYGYKIVDSALWCSNLK